MALFPYFKWVLGCAEQTSTYHAGYSGTSVHSFSQSTSDLFMRYIYLNSLSLLSEIFLIGEYFPVLISQIEIFITLLALST